MSATKFTPETRAELIGAVRASVPFTDACRHADISPDTGQAWLKRGRKEMSGPYREFSDEIARARESAETVPLSEDDLVTLLERAARKGSAKAIQMLLDRKERDPRPPSDPFADLG